MTHPANFCGRTRREFLWEAGAGFTGLALTGLLSDDGFLNRACRRIGFRQPAGRQEAALPAQGEERHLPLHVWRPQSDRHLRLQAGA